VARRPAGLAGTRAAAVGRLTALRATAFLAVARVAVRLVAAALVVLAALVAAAFRVVRVVPVAVRLVAAALVVLAALVARVARAVVLPAARDSFGAFNGALPFTTCFRATLGEKLIPLLAGIRTAAPVWGFRPIRAARRVCLKAPKPTRETRRPAFTSLTMVCSMAFTAFSASRFASCAVLLTASISSDLFTATSWFVADSPYQRGFRTPGQALTPWRAAELRAKPAAIGRTTPPAIPEPECRGTKSLVWSGVFLPLSPPVSRWEDRGMELLADGDYDAMVIEATTGPDGWRLAVVLTSGPQAGTVVDLPPIPAPVDGDPLSLLGIPGILSVLGTSLRFSPQAPD